MPTFSVKRPVFFLGGVRETVSFCIMLSYLFYSMWYLVLRGGLNVQYKKEEIVALCSYFFIFSKHKR